MWKQHLSRETELKNNLTTAVMVEDYNAVDAAREQISMLKERDYIVETYHHNSIMQQKGGKQLWYTRLPDNEGQLKRVYKKDLEELLDIVAAYYKETILSPTFRDLYLDWLNKKTQTLRKSSISKYARTWKRSFEGDDFIDMHMKDITEYELYDFIERIILSRSLTENAFADMKIIINGVFKMAKWQRLTTISITHFMGDLNFEKSMFRNIPPKPEELELFSDDEAKSLALYFVDHSDVIENLGLLLMLKSGVRVGEMVAAKSRNIDLIKLKFKIDATEIQYDKKDASGKNHRIFEIQELPKTDAGLRDLTLPPSAETTIKAIRKLNPFGEYLVMRRGKWVCSKMYNYYLKRACRTVGIPERTTHKIRKTYATALDEAGVSRRLMQKQLGHKDPRSTDPYIKDRMTEDQKREAIRSAISY